MSSSEASHRPRLCAAPATAFPVAARCACSGSALWRSDWPAARALVGSARYMARSAATAWKKSWRMSTSRRIPGRNGQRIRNELMFKSYGGDNAAQAPRYRMEIAIKETTTTTLVLRDGTSGGMIYQIDARFQLVEIATKKVLLEGISQSRATSERFTNVFSNVRAAEEAQARAAMTPSPPTSRPVSPASSARSRPEAPGSRDPSSRLHRSRFVPALPLARQNPVRGAHASWSR